MRIELSALTGAVQKIKGFADTVNQVPGVMLDFGEDKVDVCYSDGKKSIIETISISRDEGDISGRIIVAYNRLLSIIEACQSSGEIKSGDLQLYFDEEETMRIESNKYMTVRRSTGQYDLEGNPEYIEEDKVVSKFNQKLRYDDPKKSIKYGVLTRMDYRSIFDKVNTSCDVWNKDELKELLRRTSVEKGRTIYMSAQQHATFVVNLSYTVYIPTEGCVENGFVVSTVNAKALVDILSKIESENVRVNKDDRYINITDDTDTVGVWLEMTPASKTHLTSLELFKQMEYENYELVFSRAALNNVVSCAMADTKDEKTVLQFAEVDGNKVLKIVANNSGASIAGDYNVVLEGNQDKIKNWESLKGAKLPISIKSFSDMIADCQTTYIAIDIDESDKGRFMRLAEVEGRDEEGKKILGATHYSIMSR